MWKIINWRKQSENAEYEEAQKEVEIRYPGIPEKSYKMERRRKRNRIREHLDSFVSDSTLHGLHFCFDKKHMFRRILWTLLLLSAFGYVSEKLYASVMEFFSYPMSTTTRVVYAREMELPALSICNKNDFRHTLFWNTTLQKVLAQVGNFTCASLGATEYADTVKRSNHRIQDMFIAGQAAKAGETQPSFFFDKDFTSYWDSSGTIQCFTYNSGKTEPILKVSKTGNKGAVSMTFNIEQYEYSKSSSSAGLTLIVHGQDETPVKTAGISLSPGFHTHVAIAKKKIKNLPSPYKTNCGTKKLKHFNSYSQHLCWLDSLTTYVVDKCGCIDSFMPGDYKVCNCTRLMECLWPEWVYFDNHQTYTCPLPCEMYKFTSQLSFSQFPSNAAADGLASQYNLTGTPMENRLFLRENLLKVEIYYDELSYDLIEQVPSYDLKILLGDIGGQLGLFLGSSMLTYCEFFDFLMMLLYTKYFEVFLPR